MISTASRNEIIELIQNQFYPDPYVYAMWLEGSDGLGKADEYSDIDFWFDVEDGHEERVLDECERILSEISPPDVIDRNANDHPKIFQRNIHLSNTSEFLIFDICVQSHTRCTECDQEGTTYTRGDIAELPLILFDKSDVIRFVEPISPDFDELRKIISFCSDRFSQRARAVKYVKRNKYLEAHAYYMKYVCEPVMTLARVRFTPTHADYGSVHISDHFPKEFIQRLEILYKVSSIDDIGKNIPQAEILFDELMAELHELA